MTTEDSPWVFRSDMHVQLIDHMGSDAQICNYARVSTGSTGSDPGKDKGLLNFLVRDRHGSCFEHSSFTFLVSAPLFVFYEWHRHRAGWSYSEESSRYRQLEPVFYIPSEDRNLTQVGKPGAYSFGPGNDEQILTANSEHVRQAKYAWAGYQAQLRCGVAREVARNILPVSIYKTMYATCNARSLMHFLGLRRSDPDNTVPTFPLEEISIVAGKLEAEFKKALPLTHEAFVKNGRVAP